MSTQPTDARCHTDGFKLGRLSRFQSSIPLALLAAELMAGTATGGEYWVTTTGSDTTGDGTPGNPYLTISNAVAKAANPGDIVTVSNGTYNISATITISAGITVRSFGNGVYGGLANASNTVVSGGHGNFSVFTISHANAAVNGLTIRDGGNINADPFLTTGPVAGGGVNMSAGLVSECIISNNAVIKSPAAGGGVYISGGTVSNCLITANGAASRWAGFTSRGNGIYMDGGLVTRCRIIDQARSLFTAWYGGGVYMTAGMLRNCLVARNGGSDVGTIQYGATRSDSYGGGVSMTGGAIESCTIVANSIASWPSPPGPGTGGGVYWTGGTVTNSVIFANSNRTTAVTDNYAGLTSGNTAYSCTTPVLGGSNISGDPLFANASDGDYSLPYKPVKSPCIDKGANQAWMDGAKDLAGNIRKTYGGVAGSRRSPVVDIGAYEAPEAQPEGTVVMMR